MQRSTVNATRCAGRAPLLGGSDVSQTPYPNRTKAWSRVGVALLVMISANPAVYAFPKEAVLLSALAFIVIGWARAGIPLRRSDAIPIAAFTAISACHLLLFGMDVMTSSVGFLVRVLIAVFAVRLTPEFAKNFVDVMVGIAAVSLMFFLPEQLGVNLSDATAPFRVGVDGMAARHIGIHNFLIPGEEGRNAGMLGEPGMLAGYLILALLLGIVARVRRPTLVWALLVTTLLTTRSTTGYMAGMAVGVVASYSMRARNRFVGVVRGIVLVAVLVGGTFIAYERLEFLGGKIEHQWQDAMERSEASKITRFGTLLYDLKYVEERPIVGWSPLPGTRSEADRDIEDLAKGQGNGLSNFAVKFGVAGVAIFFALVYRGVRAHGASRTLAAGACGVVAMVLMGEPYLNSPAFMTLMFMPAIRPKGKRAAGQGGPFLNWDVNDTGPSRRPVA